LREWRCALLVPMAGCTLEMRVRISLKALTFVHFYCRLELEVLW